MNWLVWLGIALVRLRYPFELEWSVSKLYRYRDAHGLGRPERDTKTGLELDHAETFTDD